MSATIRPLHHSYRKVLSHGGRIKPSGMERAAMTADMYDDMSEIALNIFTDCTNAGVPFQDAVLAVYLSGLHHGGEAAKELLAEREKK